MSSGLKSGRERRKIGKQRHIEQIKELELQVKELHAKLEAAAASRGHEPIQNLAQATSTAGEQAQHQWNAAALPFVPVVSSACEQVSHGDSSAFSLEASPKDVISFNASISACENGSHCDPLALSLEEFVHASHLDVISFNASISACEEGSSGSDSQMEQAHLDQQQQQQLFLQQQLLLHQQQKFIEHILSAAAGPCQQIEMMTHIIETQQAEIEQLEARLASKDVISFSASISACAKSSQTETSIPSLDVINFKAAISACEKGTQSEHPFLPLDGSINKTISACEKGSQSETSFSSLDVISFKAATSACEKGSQSAASYPPLDFISFKPAISACEKSSQTHIGFFPHLPDRFFEVIENGGQPVLEECATATDDATFTGHEHDVVTNGHEQNCTDSVLGEGASASEKGGQWEDSVFVGTAVPAESMTEDVISFSAAVSASEMPTIAVVVDTCPSNAVSVPEDVISFSAAISACEKGGLGDSVVIDSQTLSSESVPEDVISFSAAISASEQGSLADSVFIDTTTPSAESVPEDVISFSAAISACEKGNLGDSVSIDKDFSAESVPEDVTSFSAAISACDKGLEGDSVVLTEDVMSFSAAISDSTVRDKIDIFENGPKKKRKKKKSEMVRREPKAQNPGKASRAADNGHEQCCKSSCSATEPCVTLSASGQAAAYNGHEHVPSSTCSATELDDISFNDATSAFEKVRGTPKAQNPNKVSWADIVRECGSDTAPSTADKPVTEDVISFSAAISACEKGGLGDSVFIDTVTPKAESAPEDVISFSAAISACEKGNLGDSAFIDTATSTAESVPEDVISFSAAISACEDGTPLEDPSAVIINSGSCSSCSAIEPSAAFNGHGQVATSHCSDTEPAAAVATSSCTLAEVSASFKGHEHLLVPGYLDAVAFLETLDAKYGVPL